MSIFIDITTHISISYIEIYSDYSIWQICFFFITYFLIICFYQHEFIYSIFALDCNTILFSFIIQVVLGFGHWYLFIWLCILSITTPIIPIIVRFCFFKTFLTFYTTKMLHSIDLSYVFPLPVLESATSLRIPGSFYWKIVLEPKHRALRMLLAIGLSRPSQLTE